MDANSDDVSTTTIARINDVPTCLSEEDQIVATELLRDIKTRKKTLAQLALKSKKLLEQLESCRKNAADCRKDRAEAETRLLSFQAKSRATLQSLKMLQQQRETAEQEASSHRYAQESDPSPDSLAWLWYRKYNDKNSALFLKIQTANSDHMMADSDLVHGRRYRDDMRTLSSNSASHLEDLNNEFSKVRTEIQETIKKVDDSVIALQSLYKRYGFDAEETLSNLLRELHV